MRSAPAALALAFAVVVSAGAALGVRPSAGPVHRHVLAVAPKPEITLAKPAPAQLAGYAPRPYVAPAAVSADCPQMTNPGGRNVMAAPGPDATGGSVAIGALGVTAPIVRVGFDRNYSMVLPTNARDIAWLDQGAFPGATNNVVLAGHIAWGGVTGAFAHIERLRPGDVVQVALHGKTWRYAVQYSCYFPYNSRRGAQVIGYTPVPSLTLVSCAGGWNAGAGTHSLRIVVRAVQIYPALPHEAGASASAGATRATNSPSPTPSPRTLGIVPLH